MSYQPSPVVPFLTSVSILGFVFLIMIVVSGLKTASRVEAYIEDVKKRLKPPEVTQSVVPINGNLAASNANTTTPAPTVYASPMLGNSEKMGANMGSEKMGEKMGSGNMNTGEKMGSGNMNTGGTMSNGSMTNSGTMPGNSNSNFSYIVIRENARLETAKRELIEYLPLETQLYFIQQEGAWFLVETGDGTQGWINGYDIEKINGAKAP